MQIAKGNLCIRKTMNTVELTVYYILKHSNQ
jgi:hypothetical protein